jgi:hypothetical protein
VVTQRSDELAHGHRRHIRGSPIPVRGVVAWGTIGLAAGCGLLVAFGVAWTEALLGTGGLLVILLIAYALERAGLLRPPDHDPSRRTGGPPASSGGPPREPPMP